MADNPELTAVRASHEFDERALQKFLEKQVEGFKGPLRVRQFEGGQSNPTFMLESGSGRYVMRKQPPGELLPSAHQVDREYRVMHALENTDVPVPRMFALCEDPTIIGTKFYIMEMVEGRVFTDVLLPSLGVDERRAIYRDLVRVLAALHAVDHKKVGLEEFGRPGNYYTRQVSRWTKQYLASKTETIDSMEKLIAWLPAHIPDLDESCIVHGDYRLGNVLIHPTEPKIVAVLDWELSTLGHPLADLGYICMEYHSSFSGHAVLGTADVAKLGIPSEQEFIADYCRFAGIGPVKNWNFYVIYNLFRSGCIVQGVYRRGLDGNASSERALEYKDQCRVRADRAWALVEAGG